MLWLCGLLTGAMASEEPAWKRDGWGFGGIPAANFNTDEGLGLGALATLYKYDGETSPYRISTTFLLFATTKGVHNHRIEVDALKLAGGRLRLTSRAWLDITKTNNFCGFGPDVTCDPSVAAVEATSRGLVGEEREEFERRYYKQSYIRPNIMLNARYRVGDLDSDAKLEILGGYRGVYHLPGSTKSEDPDPGSLVSQHIASGGREKGFLSVLQAGAMYDTRDFESAPSRGVWAEASVRGAHTVTGSQFDYFGYNLTGRFYVPMGTNKLVLASRTTMDGIFGEAPIRELAEMGGSVLYNFGGGLNAGRGIRQRRLLGRVKGMQQAEVRWTPLHVNKLNLDITFLTFADLLFVAESHSQLSQFGRPAFGTGGGVRFAFGDNFIIRTDVAFSAVEDFSPAVYIDINNVF